MKNFSETCDEKKDKKDCLMRMKAKECVINNKTRQKILVSYVFLHFYVSSQRDVLIILSAQNILNVCFLTYWEL